MVAESGIDDRPMVYAGGDFGVVSCTVVWADCGVSGVWGLRTGRDPDRIHAELQIILE